MTEVWQPLVFRGCKGKMCVSQLATGCWRLLEVAGCHQVKLVTNSVLDQKPPYSCFDCTNMFQKGAATLKNNFYFEAKHFLFLCFLCCTFSALQVSWVFADIFKTSYLQTRANYGNLLATKEITRRLLVQYCISLYDQFHCRQLLVN